MTDTARPWTDADAPDLAGVLAWMEGRPDAPVGHDLDAAAAQLRTLIAAADLAARAAKLDAEATKWKTRLVDETAQLLADLNAARVRVAELEQTLDATRQQLRDEAQRLMRHPAHPPPVPDTAWWLRRLAECPVCSGPSRRTTGMVCQACGKGWGPPAETTKED